jgi:hypothetical protein
MMQAVFSWSQEYPPVPVQPQWQAAAKPAAVDWDSTIAEVLERGKAVPEVHWAVPGETAALKVQPRAASSETLPKP